MTFDPWAPKLGAPMLAQFPDKLPAAVMVALETMYSRQGVETDAELVTFSVAFGKYTTPVRVAVLDEVKATLPVVVPANNTPGIALPDPDCADRLTTEDWLNCTFPEVMMVTPEPRSCPEFLTFMSPFT